MGQIFEPNVSAAQAALLRAECHLNLAIAMIPNQTEAFWRSPAQRAFNQELQRYRRDLVALCEQVRTEAHRLNGPNYG